VTVGANSGGGAKVVFTATEIGGVKTITKLEKQ
jgi:hypothetical protein